MPKMFVANASVSGDVMNNDVLLWCC